MWQHVMVGEEDRGKWKDAHAHIVTLVTQNGTINFPRLGSMYQQTTRLVEIFEARTSSRDATYIIPLKVLIVAMWCIGEFFFLGKVGVRFPEYEHFLLPFRTPQPQAISLTLLSSLSPLAALF